MTTARRFTGVFTAVVIGIATVGALVLADGPGHRSVNGTIWVANREDSANGNSVRGFDADTGAVVKTINLTAHAQPGDLAYARGKLYVAEENAPPAIAVVDIDTGLYTEILMNPGTLPHHVHASPNGDLVAVGLFGTYRVAVVDTHDDIVIGTWDVTDPNAEPGTPEPRIHAGVFSKDSRTLYLANDTWASKAGTGDVIAIDPRTGDVLWRLKVPGAHEIAVTNDGKRAYVTRRMANRLAIVDLENHTYSDVLTLGLPDTMRLSANEKLLTVGLRTTPAQLAVVDTSTLATPNPAPPPLVTLSLPADTATVAGHQWTSPNGRYTFASWERGSGPGVAVIDHDANNAVIQRLSYPGRPHGVDHARP
jgi:DNA-binding beta-propeller fold protein YncE